MSEYYKEGDVKDQLNLDSEEATQFHYFKLHDYDNNNKLDGLELYAAITHLSQHDTDGAGEGHGNEVPLDEEQVVNLVDTVLKQDDFNDDGFVDYYEFVQAQKQAIEKAQVWAFHKLFIITSSHKIINTAKFCSLH